MALARGIAADRALDRLPILADALQDAGCEDATILSHLRESHTPAPACWVMDAMLRTG